MKRNSLPYTLIIIAFAVTFALLSFIIAKQGDYISTLKKLFEENNSIITVRLTELEAKVDTDTIVQIKECEMKAIQTVINIFSPQGIARNYTIKYDFNFFSDEAYEYYLSQRRTFEGQQLITAAANGSGYNTKEESIQVFVPFFYSGFEGRTQFSFNFIKKDDNWIIESMSSDA